MKPVMTRLKTSLKSATVLAALTVALPLAAPGAAFADDPMRVVASFSILGDMVDQIGGDQIELITLVGPDGDAHVYQPTPQDARAVSEADLLIVNGLEFEGWLERLSEAANFDGVLVVATTGIDPIVFGEEDHHDEHEEDHAEAEHDHDEKHAEAEHNDADHDGHDHGAFDPHSWQNLDNAMIYVDNITAALAKADPDQASFFYTNRASYVAELETLKDDIHTMMDALPESSRTVVTSHDAFGYFAESYDLTFEAPQGVSTESEASAADVAALITQIRDENIKAVFVESITDNRLLEQIANETGAAIGGTLYSDALSGPEGPAATYLDMMRHNAEALSVALGS